MNILLISPLPPPSGGIATWTETYRDCMEKCGHSVKIINTAVIGSRVSQRQKAGLKDECVRSWRILTELWKTLRTDRFDVVQLNTSCSAKGLLRELLCLMLLKRQKVILHCHCNIEDQLHGSRAGRFMLSRAVKKAAKVLVLNQKSRGFLEALGCGSSEVVPNFIEADAVAKNHRIRPCVERVIYVGHVCKAKGFFELLEVAGELPQIVFQVAGPVYEDLSKTEIPQNVRLLGVKQRQEIMELLQKADLFFFPSHTEGFSIALLEAMASGLPIVASGVGANGDMIESEGGLIVPPGDVEAMVSAIEKMQDQKLRGNMSAWNINKVRDCYITETVIKRLLEVYKEETL